MNPSMDSPELRAVVKQFHPNAQIMGKVPATVLSPKPTFPTRSTQLEIPGAGPDVTGMLNRRAAAPLKAPKPQESCEIGLFGDEHRQLDLVDMAKRSK